MKLRNYISGLLLIAATTMQAITLQQAKSYYNDGQFTKALPFFEEAVKKTPGNANYNMWYGACLYETGQSREAKRYIEAAKTKKITDATRYLAQIALEEMDYETASALTDEYSEAIAGKEETLNATARRGYNQLRRVSEMLNNVEKIQIIDSLTVDRADFFKHYKLSRECGTLNTSDILPVKADGVTAEVYISESGNRMVWTAEDSTLCVRLAEMYRLADGKWDAAAFLPAELSMNGDAAYPYVMADGVTVYYASNGDDTIGGYDIFMTRKDFTTGEYLQPQNIGMPYNSPYDDYMLVIDEMTGIGWWATDRNRLDDKVTIYIFKRNDVRTNYDKDSDDVYSLAAVHSISDTWEEDADYSELKERIAGLGKEEQTEEAEFHFIVKNGVEYTRYDEFRSAEARGLMQKRAIMADELRALTDEVKTLRTNYATAKSAQKSKMSATILQKEAALRKANNELKQIDNRIRSLEQQRIKD